MATTETDPMEVHAVAGKILEHLQANVACSREVLVAALKVTAQTIEEAGNAQFGAELRAGILYKNRK